MSYRPKIAALEAEYGKLVNLVHEYLDEFYAADESGEAISWPRDLEVFTGWKSPDEREGATSE